MKHKELIELTLDFDGGHKFRNSKTGKKVEADIVGLASLIRIPQVNKDKDYVGMEFRRWVEANRPQYETADAFINIEHMMEQSQTQGDVHFFNVQYLKQKS